MHNKTSFLVERPMGKCWTIQAVLPSLSTHASTLQEKGRSLAVNPLARIEMATNYNGLGHKFARVRGDDRHRHICGSTNKNGHLCPLQERYYSSAICSFVHWPCLQAPRTPKVIICDRDPRFLSQFWDELFAHLGTDLRFNTAFHPQADVQSEVTN